MIESFEPHILCARGLHCACWRRFSCVGRMPWKQKRQRRTAVGDWELLLFINWRYEGNIIQLPGSCFLKNTIRYAYLAAWWKLPEFSTFDQEALRIFQQVRSFSAAWMGLIVVGSVLLGVGYGWSCITHRHPYIPCKATTSHIKWCSWCIRYGLFTTHMHDRWTSMCWCLAEDTQFYQDSCCFKKPCHFDPSSSALPWGFYLIYKPPNLQVIWYSLDQGPFHVVSKLNGNMDFPTSNKFLTSNQMMNNFVTQWPSLICTSPFYIVKKKSPSNPTSCHDRASNVAVRSVVKHVLGSSLHILNSPPCSQALLGEGWRSVAEVGSWSCLRTDFLNMFCCFHPDPWGKSVHFDVLTHFFLWVESWKWDFH